MLKKGINGAIKAVVKDCMKMERQWDRAVRQQVAPSSSTINGSGLHRAVAKLCTAGRGLGMAQESGAGPTPDLLTAVKSACLDL